MASVLVIEDEELLLDAIQRKLESEGIKAISYASGKEAVQYLKTTSEIPSAIWLDYYLKDMNGLEFMQALKEDPKLANIPVLVVSNSASEPKVKSMLALGVKKYVLKAENRLDDIIATMKQFMEEEQPKEAAA
jgi:CheY-like chemotaxis protein